MGKKLILTFFLLGFFFCLIGKGTDCYAEEVSPLDSIPRVEFQTVNGNGNSLTKPMGYVETNIKIIDGEDVIVDDSAALVKVRGNSTADGQKKPYTFKLSAKTNLFGMGKAKKWVLLANAFDPTLMRNAVALELASKFTKLKYTSQFKFVEVYMDGKFLGNYMLVEQVESGSSRVDIETDRTKDGYCGEFILQYEESRVDATATYVVTDKYNYRFEVKEPEEPTEEEIAHIKEVLNQIETCFDNKGIGDNDANLQYKYIDRASFIDCYVFNEYCKTYDFLTTSVYFYYKVTNGQGKLYAGPVWDYDLSMGNVSTTYRNAQLNNYTNYLTSKKSYQGFYATGGPLFDQLCQYSFFMKASKERYAEVEPSIKAIYEKDGYMDQLLETYNESFKRNFNEAGWDVTRQYFEFMMKPYSTYEENVSFLRNWLINRDLWLSNNFGVVSDEVIYHAEVPATCILTGTKEHYENVATGELYWDTIGTKVEDASDLDIPKIDHSFTTYSYNDDATCFNNGTETATCDYNCGTSSTRTKAGTKLTHSFTNYVSDNNGDCLTDSTKTALCDNGCGSCKTILDEKANGHIIEKTFVPASVSEGKFTAGYLLTKCTKCKEEYYKQTIPAVKSVSIDGLKSDSLIYTGKTLRPEVTILDTDKDDLDSKYYSVKYINSKNVGKASVEISFHGYYTGKIVKTFTIIPKNSTKLTLKNNAAGIQATWKNSDSSISGYELQIATDKKFTKNTKTYKIKGYSNKSKQLKSLTNKKTYYFRIRTYKTVNKQAYYSNWSSVSSLKRTVKTGK